MALWLGKQIKRERYQDTTGPKNNRAQLKWNYDQFQRKNIQESQLNSHKIGFITTYA